MASKSISKDIPLMELTLRRYEKPSPLNERDLVRKLCLSLGLLQPGDSRDVIVDVLMVLLSARKNSENLLSRDIGAKVIETRKSYRLPMNGIASSNIRRQLRRLKEIMIVEKNLNSYRINENAKLYDLFESKLEKYMLPTLTERIKEYCRKVDERF